jgi:hypothetical protein
MSSSFICNWRYLCSMRGTYGNSVPPFQRQLSSGQKESERCFIRVSHDHAS